MPTKAELLELGRRMELHNAKGKLSTLERSDLVSVSSYAGELGVTIVFAVVGQNDGTNVWAIWDRNPSGISTKLLTRTQYLEGERG